MQESLVSADDLPEANKAIDGKISYFKFVPSGGSGRAGPPDEMIARARLGPLGQYVLELGNAVFILEKHYHFFSTGFATISTNFFVQ